jgi:small subunit ribosomal protein S20
MPQRRTAKKALRQTKKKQLKNLKVKGQIKTAIKKLKKSLTAKNASESEQALRQAYKALDKAAGKKVIHRNKAAKKKSRLTRLLKKTLAK